MDIASLQHQIAALLMSEACSSGPKLLEMITVDYSKGAKQMVCMGVDKLEELSNLASKKPFSDKEKVLMFGQVVLDEGTSKNPNIKALY